VNVADMLMLAITLGIAALFSYSSFAPDWLSRRWTPARLIREARGENAVRWFFAVAALGAIVLAVAQWMRTGERLPQGSRASHVTTLGLVIDEA
jgi:hypothetical protein